MQPLLATYAKFLNHAAIGALFSLTARDYECRAALE